MRVGLLGASEEDVATRIWVCRQQADMTNSEEKRRRYLSEVEHLEAAMAHIEQANDHLRQASR